MVPPKSCGGSSNKAVVECGTLWVARARRKTQCVNELVQEKWGHAHRTHTLCARCDVRLASSCFSLGLGLCEHGSSVTLLVWMSHVTQTHPSGFRCSRKKKLCQSGLQSPPQGARRNQRARSRSASRDCQFRCGRRRHESKNPERAFTFTCSMGKDYDPQRWWSHDWRLGYTWSNSTRLRMRQMRRNNDEVCERNHHDWNFGDETQCEEVEEERKLQPKELKVQSKEDLDGEREKKHRSTSRSMLRLAPAWMQENWEEENECISKSRSLWGARKSVFVINLGCSWLCFCCLFAHDHCTHHVDAQALWVSQVIVTNSHRLVSFSRQFCVCYMVHPARSAWSDWESHGASGKVIVKRIGRTGGRGRPLGQYVMTWKLMRVSWADRHDSRVLDRAIPLSSLSDVAKEKAQRPLLLLFKKVERGNDFKAWRPLEQHDGANASQLHHILQSTMRPKAFPQDAGAFEVA